MELDLGSLTEQCRESEAEWCDQHHRAGHLHSQSCSTTLLRHRFLTIFSLLACRVHLALLVPLAKMALMESLAPLGLQVPVDAQEKQALL